VENKNKEKEGRKEQTQLHFSNMMTDEANKELEGEGATCLFVVVDAKMNHRTTCR